MYRLEIISCRTERTYNSSDNLLKIKRQNFLIKYGKNAIVFNNFCSNHYKFWFLISRSFLITTWLFSHSKLTNCLSKKRLTTFFANGQVKLRKNFAKKSRFLSFIICLQCRTNKKLRKSEICFCYNLEWSKIYILCN